MNPAVDVSVIIPTYNRSHLLLRLLQSLERQNFTGTYDVVVVDDGSNDDTRNVLSQYQPRCPYPLKILRQPNAGPGPARNRGIGVAQGRILAFIDDDHIARPEWMSEISDIPEGPRSAGQCGRNVSLPGRSATSRYGTMRGLHERPHLYDDGTVRDFMSGNAALYRWALNQIGGFDDRFTSTFKGIAPGGEDTALSIRLRERKFLIHYNPQALTDHHQKGSFSSFLKEAYNFGGNRVRYEALSSKDETPVGRHTARLFRAGLGFVKWPVEALRFYAARIPLGDALIFPFIERASIVAHLLGAIRTQRLERNGFRKTS